MGGLVGGVESFAAAMSWRTANRGKETSHSVSMSVSCVGCGYPIRCCHPGLKSRLPKKIGMLQSFLLEVIL